MKKHAEYDEYCWKVLEQYRGIEPMSYKDWLKVRKALPKRPPSDGAANHNWCGQPLR